jgi:hypothetical protein
MAAVINEELLPNLKADNKRGNYKTTQDAEIYELHHRGYTPYAIHTYLVRVHGDKAVTRGTVYNRIRALKAQ